MNHKRRGHAIIFNHEKFRNNNLKERKGTNVDGDRLERILKELGFIVHVCNDFTYEKIQKKLYKVSQFNHKNCDCLIVAVMTHGDLDELNAYDYYYACEKLWLPFTQSNCPSLKGKPKLFFIQACRGKTFDATVTLSNSVNTAIGTRWTLPCYERSEKEIFMSHMKPEEEDFLIAYSTQPGHYSMRNNPNGSWFIQSLCQQLEINAYNMNLTEILTCVSHYVAIECISNNPDIDYHERKVIPNINSTLKCIVLFSGPCKKRRKM